MADGRFMNFRPSTNFAPICNLVAVFFLQADQEQCLRLGWRTRIGLDYVANADVVGVWKPC